MNTELRQIQKVIYAPHIRGFFVPLLLLFPAIPQQIATTNPDFFSGSSTRRIKNNMNELNGTRLFQHLIKSDIKQHQTTLIFSSEAQ